LAQKRIQLRYHETPPQLLQDAEASTAAVIIDVLRATTTLAHAFAAGAREALFFATPESAFAARDRLGSRHTLLCGERDGIRIPSFDLGNSPLEYRAEVVRDKTLLFASTNGSLAFLATKDAGVQWATGFVNLEAALERALTWLKESERLDHMADRLRRIDVVCAGKLGKPAIEDSSCAALWIERLSRRLSSTGRSVELEASALPRPPRDESETYERITDSPHGRYLSSLGEEFKKDLIVCSRWDSLTLVPTGKSSRLVRSELPAA
jgi:2-phosphosulfolactate phosphatase